MRPRKSKDIAGPLRKKGFLEKAGGSHHAQYYLLVQGKKTHIKTYLSHGKGMEYSSGLMKAVKKQLCFKEDADAERFLDCPMSGEEYVALLRKQGDL